MSVFGDGNIKTDIYDELKYIFNQHYNKDFYDGTNSERIEFIEEITKVLSVLIEDVV